MSRGAVELVRIAMQAYGQGDYEIALALADPLLRWDERPAYPDGELVWGHDEVLRFLRRHDAEWEQYEFRLEELIDAGDRVIAVYRERGWSLEGVPIGERHASVWTVEDGKIVACSIYLTKEEALRAARETGTPRFSDAA
jgi:ketosteroid isomerase-like protein